MIPKKSKEILKKVTVENNLDESYAQDAVSFVWSEIKKALTDMSTPSLYIKNLGKFDVKKGRLNKSLINYESYLENKTPKSFEEYSHRMTIEKTYKKYLAIKDMLTVEHMRKVEKIKIKKQYVASKDMEQSLSDSGGDKE